jgi:hypothetical protein
MTRCKRESFAKLFSAGNRELLQIISLEAPGSLDDLARISGRANPNLSRKLKTMEGSVSSGCKRLRNLPELPLIEGQDVGREPCISH